MRIRFAAFVFSCTLPSVAAHAQPVFMNISSQINGDTATVTFNSQRMPFVAAVAGAPFTADRVSEHTQTLADGTHIRQAQNSEHVSRDSQGRTRTERPLMRAMAGNLNPNEFRLTEIVDPGAGFAYVLDDQSKIAHRVVVTAPPQRLLMVNQVARPATGVVGTVGVGGGIASGGVMRDGTVVGTRPTVPVTRPQVTTEKLAARNIEGIITDGMRTTTTWPENSQGNDRPIVQISETWRSTELRETILLTSNDPRSGESITRLINISRAEPDASLFQPPPGYTVVDEKDSFTMTIKRQ